MAAAYVIVTMNVTDPDKYKGYMGVAPAAIRAAGGEYLARGGKQETLEGDWHPHRVAVLKFPSYEKAKAWYDGEQYLHARAHRMGATEYFHMVLVEGVDSQPWD
jgi:uncharacterized protein (DUF1330 family)